MTQPQENNSQSFLAEKLFNPLLENMGQVIGKILGIGIIIGIIIFVLNNHGSLFSLVGFDISDPRILIPLGASTGLIVFMTTILSTPVSVAVGVAILICLVFEQYNPF